MDSFFDLQPLLTYFCLLAVSFYESIYTFLKVKKPPYAVWLILYSHAGIYAKFTGIDW
jgi:hypothetical protein